MKMTRRDSITNSCTWYSTDCRNSPESSVFLIFAAVILDTTWEAEAFPINRLYKMSQYRFDFVRSSRELTWIFWTPKTMLRDYTKMDSNSPEGCQRHQNEIENCWTRIGQDLCENSSWCPLKGFRDCGHKMAYRDPLLRSNGKYLK